MYFGLIDMRTEAEVPGPADAGFSSGGNYPLDRCGPDLSDGHVNRVPSSGLDQMRIARLNPGQARYPYQRP